MKFFTTRSIHRALLPLLLASLTLTACDSNSDSSSAVGDVAGEYLFERFQFIPDSGLLQPVNLLDTLQVSNTRLQLFSSGRFTLLYQFVGKNEAFIGGDFTANDRRVRLNGAEDEEKFFQAMLLSKEIILMRESDGSLSGDMERNVNLEAFSNRYRGLPAVQGHIILDLRRR